jgi:predicted ester cyclase
MLAEDFVEHEEMPGLTPGRDGVGELFAMFGAAFPDVRWEPEDVLADGDKIAVRVRVTGTNNGEFMGMAATGKRVSVQLIDILRIGVDGRIAEHWGVFDMFALMHQLGVVGAPA